jgi:hypothetical protein
MHEGTNDTGPAEVPVRAEVGPAARWRAMTLLGIGVGVGLVLGVLLTFGASATFTFLNPVLPLPADRNPVEILNELNDLRLQVNRLSEAKKLYEQDKDDSLRRALGSLASVVRARSSVTSGVASPAEKPGGAAGGPPTARGYDPFAELDAEIKNLETTQEVLNSILDLFLGGKEPSKDRPGVTAPPK